MTPIDTLISATNSGEPVPPDIIGRAIFAAVKLGPMTCIASILIWQGIKITNALQDERRETINHMQAQTERVVEGLANSTNAIEEFTDLSKSYIDAIDTNSNKLDENRQSIDTNTKILERNGVNIERALDRLSSE